LLSEILRTTVRMPVPPELLVGIETADDAPCTGSTTSRRWWRPPTFSCRSSTTRSISAASPPPTRSPTSTRWGPADPGAGAGRHAGQRASGPTIRRILEGGEAVCEAAGIPIAGGHSIDSVEPIYGLVVLGLVHPRRVKRNCDASPGDRVVLGKALGVGIYSAALKKEGLDEAGYASMIATTTRLNTPGPDLAAIDGVGALSDVTGSGWPVTCWRSQAIRRPDPNRLARCRSCRARASWRRPAA